MRGACAPLEPPPEPWKVITSIWRDYRPAGYVPDRSELLSETPGEHAENDGDPGDLLPADPACPVCRGYVPLCGRTILVCPRCLGVNPVVQRLLDSMPYRVYAADQGLLDSYRRVIIRPTTPADVRDLAKQRLARGRAARKGGGSCRPPSPAMRAAQRGDEPCRPPSP
jgi:hypothetical protein